MKTSRIKLLTSLQVLLKPFLLFLILILHLCKLSSQKATAPSTGTGTSSNPYQIATLDNLYWIYSNSTEWNKHYPKQQISMH